MSSPLAGRVVLEVSGDVATRYSGKLFAEHGADVVQAYTPDNRHIGRGGVASQAYAAWLDAGKRRMNGAAAPPDVIIAGQYPDDIARAERLWEQLDRQPVLLALTWFGQTGPYANWRGSDVLIQALTGVAYAFGEPDAAPTLPQGHAPQVVAGVTAYIAALAALIGRDQGLERVRRVDVNVHQAHMCLSEHGGPGFAATRVHSARRGVNRYFPVYPQTIFAAADGWIGVTALTPQQWQGFCELIGLPALARDARFTTTDLRMAAARELDVILGDALKRFKVEHLLIEGQKRRVPMAPVPTPAELFETPHWRERGSFRRFAGPENGMNFEAPAMPFRLHRRDGGTDGGSDGGSDGGIGGKSDGSNGALGSSGQPAAARSDRRGPLAGVRVLDLSMGWSGPLAGRHYADLGADVIKVEGCAHLDWWRGWNALEAGDPPPHETKPNFNAVNRNKQGITLELRGDAGRELLKRLARESDVLIENYAPGVLDRLGLSARALAEINPNLVYVSMGAFGSAGPWSDFRAYGSTTEQASGFCFLNGEADWPPCMQHTAYGDPIAGIYAAAATLTAVFGRRQTASGTTIDLSQVECLFQLAADGLIAQSATGQAPLRTGSDCATSLWSGCVRCAGADRDDWLAIDLRESDGLAARLQSLGLDATVANLPLRDGLPESQRPALRAALTAAFSQWASARTVETAAGLLQSAGIIAGPVLRATALLEDPQLLASDYWIRLQRAHVGLHVLPSAPYSIDGRVPQVLSPAPTLGQHNAAVLSRVLGLSAEQIAGLERDAVIGDRPA